MNEEKFPIDFEYLFSLKIGWEKIIIQERQKLKPNDVSLLKCFVLNRLLYEYEKVRLQRKLQSHVSSN